jgi:hypothetical protein
MSDEINGESNKVSQVRPLRRHRRMPDGTCEIMLDRHQLNRLCAQRGYFLLQATLYGGFKLEARQAEEAKPTLAINPADGSDEFSLDEIYEWIGRTQPL